MEDIKEEIKEEKIQRWTTILLIIANVIIWSIIFLFISIAKVDAAPTTYPLDAWSVGHSGQDSGAKANGASFSWAWVKADYSSAYVNIVFTARNGTTTAHARVETNFPNFCLFSTYVWEGNVKMNLTVTRQCSGTNNNIVDYYFQMVSHQGQNITLQLKPIAPLTILQNMSITATVSGSQDVELSNDLTNDTFINATNNQTTTIVNNITENVNELKEGFINALDDTTQHCVNYDYLNSPQKEVGYLYSDGTIQQSNGWKVSDYIKIEKNNNYLLERSWDTNTNVSYCLYDENKSLLNCTRYLTNTTFNITPNTKGFIRYSIGITNERETTFTGNYCEDRTEATINAIDEFKQMFNVEPWEDVEPDDSEFEETHAMEEDILEMADDIDLTNVNLEIDTESSNWVWATLTTLINTHQLVFGMVISILSIGIIKLLLNR